MSICFPSFHQAPNVHGLGATAHGAMVEYDLQSAEPLGTSENAAAPRPANEKALSDELHASERMGFSYIWLKGSVRYVEGTACALGIP